MCNYNLDDFQNLEWFYTKYADSVKRGKPDHRSAQLLKTFIDTLNVKYYITPIYK